MFKIILKTANKTLETRILANPAKAAEAWADMRADDSHQGQPVDLIAAYENSIFLRHRFDTDEKEMYFVPADRDMEPVFFLAMASSGLGVSTSDIYNTPLRKIGRPQKGSAEAVDWEQQDWSLSDAELSRQLGVTRQAVQKARKKHAPS